MMKSAMVTGRVGCSDMADLIKLLKREARLEEDREFLLFDINERDDDSPDNLADLRCTEARLRKLRKSILKALKAEVKTRSTKNA